MNKRTYLRNNIWIEGFSTEKMKDNQLHNINYANELSNFKNAIIVMYEGETSEVPEKLAKNVLYWMFWDEKVERLRYKNYNNPIGVTCPFIDYMDSLKSACDYEFCIIFETLK